MDDLEGKHDVKADQRVAQFVRLRDAIEERASRKFSERPVEAEGPVVLRTYLPHLERSILSIANRVAYFKLRGGSSVVAWAPTRVGILCGTFA
jgi:hypothetical protein